MASERPTLGALLRGLRSRNNWTLKQMSVASGIPVSTLGKVEHDQLTLTYDKLLQMSEKLGLSLAELFAEPDSAAESPVTARRSIGLLDRALRVETPNYDYHYLCTELRRKRMIPIVFATRAKSLDQFGDLVRHSGEEFIYVQSGQIEVHTEFYDPVLLEIGEGLYIDSNMGHAYLAGPACDEATALAVCSSPDEDLMHSLMSLYTPDDDPASSDRTRSTKATKLAIGSR